MKIDLNKYKKYLPSKKFAALLGILAGGVLVILIGTSFFGAHTGFNRKSSIEAKGTVGELIGKDSNNNSIADWEESLWGLDPKGDGSANKAIIEQKRRTATLAASTNDSGIPTPPGTETEKLSKDILKTILALQQSGTLTEEAITNIALSIGTNIDTEHSLEPAYSVSDLHEATGETHQVQIDYGNKLQAILKKYQSTNIGNEFDIIDRGLTEGSEDSLKELGSISKSYIDLSKEIMDVPTPRDAKPYVVPFANSLAALGQSLAEIEVIYSDAATGLIGVSHYTKAINAYEYSLERFTSYFSL